jgi:thiamine biosynthesis lipoprotein
MTGRSFRAMDTPWWIRCDVPELLAPAEALVRQVEARLSRFQPDSALSRLNLRRTLEDPWLAEVVQAALRLRERTGGAFDPTLGARLAELGYDRTFAAIGQAAPAPAAYRHLPLGVHVDGDRVSLDGLGSLDLGGIGKGWTVDHVRHWLLAAGAREVLVDGGGDIRGAGRPWSIGVADGLVVDAGVQAVATSSNSRRRWKNTAGAELHHLLDPRTGLPADSALDTATVVAADAMTADALATAVLVAPEQVLPLLPALGASAIVRGRDGRWWSTSAGPWQPQAAPGERAPPPTT